MTSARDEIFANIRRSLGVDGKEASRRFEVETRLRQAPVGIIPARGQLDPPQRIALFRRQVEAAMASVTTVASQAAVPAEIARFLREANLPATLAMGADVRLAEMPWTDTALNLSHGASRGDDLNAASYAFAGVAESGTLVLTSGADNPTTLNFLPDTHIVVIDGADVAGDFESVWASLRQRADDLPRTVNLVTGPSRSGDIEQKLLLGAHGPRRLHVIIVDPAGSATM